MSAADSFFDTNVLLYLLSKDAAKADLAEALLATGGLSACRCSMNLHRSLPASWR